MPSDAALQALGYCFCIGMRITHQSIIKTTFLLYVMISGAIARE
jgi:hypothetical protein